jgi:predicted nucleic acid-binding Zn ribbon protein
MKKNKKAPSRGYGRCACDTVIPVDQKYCSVCKSIKRAEWRERERQATFAMMKTVSYDATR